MDLFLCPFPNLGDTFPDPSLLLRLNSRPASKNLSPVSRERCRVLQLLVKIHQRDPTAKDWKQTNISKYIYYVLYQGSASNSGGEMDQTLKRVNGELRWIAAAINCVFFAINIVQNDRVATGSHWPKTSGLRPQDKRPEGGRGQGGQVVHHGHGQGGPVVAQNFCQFWTRILFLSDHWNWW